MVKLSYTGFIVNYIAYSGTFTLLERFYVIEGRFSAERLRKSQKLYLKDEPVHNAEFASQLSTLQTLIAQL
jgi:hypothetical protein